MKLWSWYTSCPEVPCRWEITTSVVTCSSFSFQRFPGPSYPEACRSWFNCRFSCPPASTYVGLGGHLGEGLAKGRCFCLWGTRERLTWSCSEDGSGPSVIPQLSVRESQITWRGTAHLGRARSPGREGSSRLGCQGHIQRTGARLTLCALFSPEPLIQSTPPSMGGDGKETSESHRADQGL